MSACPSRAEWSEFLADRLDPAQQTTLIEHAESCGRCVTLLEELTALADAAAPQAPGSDLALELGATVVGVDRTSAGASSGRSTRATSRAPRAPGSPRPGAGEDRAEPPRAGLEPPLHTRLRYRG